MIKVVMVAIAFMGDVPGNSKIFAMPPGTDLAACEAERLEVVKAGAAQGIEIWTACLEVKREPKPLVDPKHRDPKSESAS